MSKTHWISPIAIDLGAKNTGVYYAHYNYKPNNSFSSLKDIQKDGKVYQLEKDKYTLLMVNRTATRHQRRGFDRRQMVKRLFKLIWENHFELKWDKGIQQAISFLLNRRGFTFLTEQYDKDILSQLPEEVYEELPNEMKNEIEKNQENGGYDFDSSLHAWSKEGKEKLESIFDILNKEPKRVAQRQVFINRTKQLKDYCKDPQKHQISSNKKKSDLTHISRWILEEWKKDGVEGLPDNIGNQTDLTHILKKKDQQKINIILESLPNISQEDQELRNSIWNFKSESFKLEKAKLTIAIYESGNQDNETETSFIKKHLNHLAFAIYKNLEELKSGSRHRSNYFKEVKDVLENKKHIHNHLKTFCKNLHLGNYKPLDFQKLTHLIGHLSNLELKPLRKYFNDEKHKKNDYWNETRLNKIFDRWILHEWRVNPKKDKDKAENKDYDYKKLKEKWKDHKKNRKNVIDFWLNTCPNWTIPPYQDNNNRRPPKCQSLILNPKFLNKKYLKWQDWLSEIKQISEVKEYLGIFENTLKNDLQTGKEKSYFKDKLEGSLERDSGCRTDKDLQTRILQFIFDRVKVTDPLKLNEIYSHAKKIKQLKRDHQSDREAREKLEKTIRKSKLPNNLKVNPNFEEKDIFKEGSFFHLICRYYKLRQRARDSRLFIYPEYKYIKSKGCSYENTGRFDDKNHLLTYCNHKPRQKHYQMLNDIAGVLQINPEKLREVILSHNNKVKEEPEEENLIQWLKEFQGLKTNCEKASKEQRDRRGTLKLDIQRIYGLIYHKTQERESPFDLSNQKIKEILKTSKIEDASKLYNFCEKAKKLCLEITNSLYNDSEQKEWEKNIEKNPASAIYFLSQIHNIAFKERSGNAKTCAVCSVDNAHRMIQVPLENNINSTTKAQRLPAIETRLIDGAVMRLARIVGNAIAKDKWKIIEKEFEQGHNVHIPIITESNRFEFEPKLKDLKGLKKKNNKDGITKTSKDIYKAKEDRIREASQKISPYSGKQLSEDGELDHIIPRASEHGILNDEANLIYTSREDNRTKGNQRYSLSSLSSEYKKKQFDTDNNEKIMNWIIEQIGDGESEDFKFGKYRSFINLTPDQQKAFRHALFLADHPLHKKVIRAIDNRSRSFVNGTQRYFAEVLANNLYKKAKAIKKQHLLSFDYFGVETQSNTRGDGIYDLRKSYEEAYPEFFEKYKKDNNKQNPYSPLNRCPASLLHCS